MRCCDGVQSSSRGPIAQGYITSTKPRPGADTVSTGHLTCIVPDSLDAHIAKAGESAGRRARSSCTACAGTGPRGQGDRRGAWHVRHAAVEDPADLAGRAVRGVLGARSRSRQRIALLLIEPGLGWWSWLWCLRRATRAADCHAHGLLPGERAHELRHLVPVAGIASRDTLLHLVKGLHKCIARTDVGEPYLRLHWPR